MQPDTLTYKRRQPWFAAFMSLILPGYGQLYNGDINKATWLFLGFSLLAIPVMVVIALYLPVSWTFPTLLLSLLTIIGLWGYSVVDAFRTARRLQDYVLKPWQRGSLYVLVLLLCNGIALPLLTDFVRDHWVESFHIPSASMQPTLLPGGISCLPINVITAPASSRRCNAVILPFSCTRMTAPLITSNALSACRGMWSMLTVAN